MLTLMMMMMMMMKLLIAERFNFSVRDRKIGYTYFRHKIEITFNDCSVHELKKCCHLRSFKVIRNYTDE